MKAITLPQPAASMVAAGVMPLTVHGYRVEHIGPVAIHAKAELSVRGRDACFRQPLCEALHGLGFGKIEMIPLGGIVGIAELERTVRVDMFREFLARYDWRLIDVIGDPKGSNFFFEWRGVIHFDRAIRCSGNTGLWDLPEVVAANVGHLYAQHRTNMGGGNG